MKYSECSQLTSSALTVNAALANAKVCGLVEWQCKLQMPAIPAALAWHICCLCSVCIMHGVGKHDLLLATLLIAIIEHISLIKIV
jgi:hypothetical protein